MERPLCMNCPFWFQQTNPKMTKIGMEGECRRHSPPALPIFLATTTLKRGNWSIEFNGWEWPETKKNDFCGDHPRYAAYVKFCNSLRAAMNKKDKQLIEEAQGNKK